MGQNHGEGKKSTVSNIFIHTPPGSDMTILFLKIFKLAHANLREMCLGRPPLIYPHLICAIHATLFSYNTVGLFLMEDNPHGSLMCCIMDLNQTHSLLAS